MVKSWPARLIESGEKASGVHPDQRGGLSGREGAEHSWISAAAGDGFSGALTCRLPPGLGVSGVVWVRGDVGRATSRRAGLQSTVQPGGRRQDSPVGTTS